MTKDDQVPSSPPSAFFSYSWDSQEHRRWVADLGSRLRADGIDLLLDEWHLRPGDQLPHFMERAVRKSSFVLIICTPRYRQKSDSRSGGVGYEGNVITAELYTAGNERKFVPILREGEWTEAAPSWLLGKMYLDLRGDPYSEANYNQLVNTLHGLVAHAPVVRSAVASSAQRLSPQAVTNQAKYVEFINAARRSFLTANKKFVLYKNGSSVAQVIMGKVQDELDEQAAIVNNLLFEILALSSDPVKQAAGEVAGWVLAAQVTSMAPDLEEKFKEVFGKFNHEALPKLTAAVREEAGLR